MLGSKWLRAWLGMSENWFLLLHGLFVFLVACVGWVQMLGVLVVCGLCSTGTTKACVFCGFV